MTIYHNSRCRISREGLEYLKSKTSQFETRQYLKEALTLDELKMILLKLNMKPLALVRTQEEIYKKELKGLSFTDEEWMNILLEHPKLIQRPIVVTDTKAVLAHPASEIDKLF